MKARFTDEQINGMIKEQEDVNCQRAAVFGGEILSLQGVYDVMLNLT